MNIHLLDQAKYRSQLLPLSYTRPLSEIRVGILLIKEKWEKYFDSTVYSISEDYLACEKAEYSDDNLVINSVLLPDQNLVSRIQNLQQNEALFKEGVFLAVKAKDVPTYGQLNDSDFDVSEYTEEINLIERPWHIFLKNGDEIKRDYELITKNRTSSEITDPHTIVYASENVFLEEGVSTKACVLNAESGPIYLGKNSQVHEGAYIRGPFALGESSHVNMGAKIRGDSTFGPHCKVGGEVANAVIFGYSSKAHDGYFGNSVIGEWCNIGADTNTSNLKNNYAKVKVWDYSTGKFENTGLQFCGLIMGDHSKCAINTMFNTGTVVGVSANIFGAGFPRNMIPSFSWGGVQKSITYSLNKAKETAIAAMNRRDISWTEKDEQIFQTVFEQTAEYRMWEKNSDA